MPAEAAARFPDAVAQAAPTLAVALEFGTGYTSVSCAARFCAMLASGSVRVFTASFVAM
jgi:hypothetical protein